MQENNLIIVNNMIIKSGVATSKFSDTEIKALANDLRCKDHLCSNIKDVNFGGSTEDYCSIVGGHSWTLGERTELHSHGRLTLENGANMKFTQIHQKWFFLLILSVNH